MNDKNNKNDTKINNERIMMILIVRVIIIIILIIILVIIIMTRRVTITMIREKLTNKIKKQFG